MPYTIERIEPAVYYCLWTGEMTKADFLKISHERATMAVASGDDPYIFIAETRDARLQDWDIQLARRGVEMEPIPLLFIVILDNMLVQIAINLIKLFVRMESQPTLPAALDRTRQLLRAREAQRP